MDIKIKFAPQDWVFFLYDNQVTQRKVKSVSINLSGLYRISIIYHIILKQACQPSLGDKDQEITLTEDKLFASKAELLLSL